MGANFCSSMAGPSLAPTHRVRSHGANASVAAAVLRKTSTEEGEWLGGCFLGVEPLNLRERMVSPRVKSFEFAFELTGFSFERLVFSQHDWPREAP